MFRYVVCGFSRTIISCSLCIHPYLRRWRASSNRRLSTFYYAIYSSLSCLSPSRDISSFTYIYISYTTTAVLRTKRNNNVISYTNPMVTNEQIFSIFVSVAGAEVFIQKSSAHKLRHSHPQSFSRILTYIIMIMGLSLIFFF